MYTIYCIEDINDLKYVGSTKQTLANRFNGHTSMERNNIYCSSSKLDLEYCIIYSLETDVSKKDKKDRERYWINKIECVNELKLNGSNIEKHKEKQKVWYQENKEKRRVKRKDYFKEREIFRLKSVVNGCYEFIKMLEEY